MSSPDMHRGNPEIQRSKPDFKAIIEAHFMVIIREEGQKPLTMDEVRGAALVIFMNKTWDKMLSEDGSVDPEKFLTAISDHIFFKKCPGYLIIFFRALTKAIESSNNQSRNEVASEETTPVVALEQGITNQAGIQPTPRQSKKGGIIAMSAGIGMLATAALLAVCNPSRPNRTDGAAPTAESAETKTASPMAPTQEVQKPSTTPTELPATPSTPVSTTEVSNPAPSTTASTTPTQAPPTITHRTGHHHGNANGVVDPWAHRPKTTIPPVIDPWRKPSKKR